MVMWEMGVGIGLVKAVVGLYSAPAADDAVSGPDTKRENRVAPISDIPTRPIIVPVMTIKMLTLRMCRVIFVSPRRWDIPPTSLSLSGDP